MILNVFVISFLSAFLTIFLNYIIGKPASKEFSPYEIFSAYTVWLSKRRLKNVGLLWEYKNQYKEDEARVKSKSQLILLKNDYKKIYYEAAEPYFKLERAFGMCPICTCVWVAFFISVISCQDIIGIITVILTSHIIIRLLTKII